ncbi:MAG: hypothetical protein JXR91_10395 [Deltaproteobacteria bacterium]|nr:hypothetical protein [Deltaproteobacteria bacterium]
MNKMIYNRNRSFTGISILRGIAMKNIFKALALISAIIAMGCVDNEESFYIEHAKSVPSDSCEFNTGDPFSPTFSINLFSTINPGTAFLVTNALMKQEDQGTLKNESNGIMIDGFELYTLIPGQGAVGGTEYFKYNQYIAPDSSDIVIGDLMSSTVITTLKSSFGCHTYSPNEIKEAILYPNDSGNKNVRHNLTVGDNGNLANLPEVMTAVVKFLGHTQGGKNLETQEFSVRLFMACGAYGGWDPCFDNGCTAFCNSAAALPAFGCDPGLNVAYSCSDYLKQIDSSVRGTAVSATEFNISSDGLDSADYCVVQNCP